MPDIEISLNGRPLRVTSETSLAAAILNSGHTAFRTSVCGQARAPLCGMGICFECRVTVDGLAHTLACQILCRQGMIVVTG